MYKTRSSSLAQQSRAAIMRCAGGARKAGKRAVQIASNAYIAIAKSAVDFLLWRKPATISFERLKSIRPFFYLLCAVARAGVAGCPAHDAHRAKKWFPEEFRNVRVRWLPAKGFRLGPNVK